VGVERTLESISIGGRIHLGGATLPCRYTWWGDGCIIDGGLAIFAGTKVSISLEELKKIAEES